jgi:hypothetical protein
MRIFNDLFFISPGGTPNSYGEALKKKIILLLPSKHKEAFLDVFLPYLRESIQNHVPTTLSEQTGLNKTFIVQSLIVNILMMDSQRTIN